MVVANKKVVVPTTERKVLDLHVGVWGVADVFLVDGDAKNEPWAGVILWAIQNRWIQCAGLVEWPEFLAPVRGVFGAPQ